MAWRGTVHSTEETVNKVFFNFGFELFTKGCIGITKRFYINRFNKSIVYAISQESNGIKQYRDKSFR